MATITGKDHSTAPNPFLGGLFGRGGGHGSRRGRLKPLSEKDEDVFFDGKRMRKPIHRKTVDYNPSIIHYLESRVFRRGCRDQPTVQPDSLYSAQLVPPVATLSKPMNCVTTRFVRTSTNKFRCPIFCVAWTSEGRRLVTGASSGEFTLWNGLTFNFETILQAHDVSVRAMRWSHNDQWMVTADHSGFVKYWQSNMNNVKMYQAHKDPVRGVSFSPLDSKFATCSDDGTVRIWDFMRCHEESILRGHGADVKCVDWHPQKSLVVSGSKDNQQPIKLWDPRTGTSLATLHAHKHTVMDLRWNQNGHWLLTAARDHLLKLFDIRNMKSELQTFKGHKKEATVVSWHPTHESLFASGGSDGALMFWLVGCDREIGNMEEAHDGMIWSAEWHPLGHILASGSNDHATKFWTRNRPGDEMRDRYNLNNLPAGVDQEILDIANQDVQAAAHLPGMGLEHGLPEHLSQIGEEDGLEIPGLDINRDSLFFEQINNTDKLTAKKTSFIRPIPRNFEKAWQNQEIPVTESSGAGKPGLLGNVPQNLSPAALSMLMLGNTGNIPQSVVVGIMEQMKKQPELLAIGQQMFQRHHNNLLKQMKLSKGEENSTAAASSLRQHQAQESQVKNILNIIQQKQQEVMLQQEFMEQQEVMLQQQMQQEVMEQQEVMMQQQMQQEVMEQQQKQQEVVRQLVPEVASQQLHASLHQMIGSQQKLAPARQLTISQQSPLPAHHNSTYQLPQASAHQLNATCQLQTLSHCLKDSHHHQPQVPAHQFTHPHQLEALTNLAGSPPAWHQQGTTQLPDNKPAAGVRDDSHVLSRDQDHRRHLTVGGQSCAEEAEATASVGAVPMDTDMRRPMTHNKTCETDDGSTSAVDLDMRPWSRAGHDSPSSQSTHSMRRQHYQAQRLEASDMGGPLVEHFVCPSVGRGSSQTGCQVSTDGANVDQQDYDARLAQRKAPVDRSLGWKDIDERIPPKMASAPQSAVNAPHWSDADQTCGDNTDRRHPDQYRNTERSLPVYNECQHYPREHSFMTHLYGQDLETHDGREQDAGQMLGVGDRMGGPYSATPKDRSRASGFERETTDVRSDASRKVYNGPAGPIRRGRGNRGRLVGRRGRSDW